MSLNFLKKIYQSDSDEDKDNIRGIHTITSDEGQSNASFGEEYLKNDGQQNQTVDYDAAIIEKKAQIERIKAEINELLSQKVNANPKINCGFKIGDIVYYPAPPQLDIIACILEVEETEQDKLVFFVRPICYKKDGTSVLSKRHYLLGSDLAACNQLYRNAPPNAKTIKVIEEAESEAKPKHRGRKKKSMDVSDLLSELAANPDLANQLKALLND